MFYGSEGVALSVERGSGLSVEQVSPVEYIFPASENVDLSNLMGIALLVYRLGPCLTRAKGHAAPPYPRSVSA